VGLVTLGERGAGGHEGRQGGERGGQQSEHQEICHGVDPWVDMRGRI
jgi:hypothetical protein